MRLVGALAGGAVCMLSGCVGGPTLGPKEGHLDDLTRVLTGSFSSVRQAEADPENFFDIRLQAVEIWADRANGPWLYVEQAAASALERPYRQRIYRLAAHSWPVEGGPVKVWRSDVYTFDDPLRFAGAWRAPERFDRELTPEDLTPRDGCTIYLRWDADQAAFVGATRGTGCESTLRGASYATSEVALFADRLETWDRGYDADGEQAWGATEGPYVFDRVE
ncbi:MAG: chromophore lyase CpcT/CpeT [Phycisphaerales bacterium]